MLRIFALSITFLFATVGVAAEARAWSGDSDRGAGELEAQWKEILNPSPTVEIRGVFRFALEAAGLKWHPERIEAALALAREMQDLDPASKTYGNFKWRRDHKAVLDSNAVEFSMQQAALLRLRHAHVLTPEGLRRLDQIMATAVEGIRRHDVKIETTSVYLVKTWNLIATFLSAAASCEPTATLWRWTTIPET